MTTIKAYTDLSQSKVLAEILPLESADMRYHTISHYNPYPCDEIVYTIDFGRVSDKDIPCWSLAALLDILPKEIEIDGQHYAPRLFPVKSRWLLKLWYNSNYTITSPIAIFSDNPIDACYEMIIKLHELKML